MVKTWLLVWLCMTLHLLSSFPQMAIIRACSAEIQWDAWYEDLPLSSELFEPQKMSVLLLLFWDELLGHDAAGCVEPQGLMSRRGLSKLWQGGNYEGCEMRLWKVNPSLLWRSRHGPKALMGYTEVPGAGRVTGIRRLSVISQTLLEAIRSCLKSFPESSLGQ